MKKLTKKQLTIIATAVAAVLLIIGGVFIATSEKRVTELVTIEYGEKINSDEITPLIGKNEMPDIDTKAMGETEYVLASGRTLIVTVEDTQKPVFKGDDKFTTEFGVAIKLEDKVTAEDPIDGKLKVEFTKVDYKKAGDQKVTATATDVNGNTTTKEITVTVKEEVIEVVEEVEEVVEETTSNNDTSYTEESYTPTETPSNNGGGSTGGSTGGGSSNGGGSSQPESGYAELTYLGMTDGGSYQLYKWAYKSWSWSVEVEGGSVQAYGAGAPQAIVQQSIDLTSDMAF